MYTQKIEGMGCIIEGDQAGYPGHYPGQYPYQSQYPGHYPGHHQGHYQQYHPGHHQMNYGMGVVTFQSGFHQADTINCGDYGGDIGGCGGGCGGGDCGGGCGGDWIIFNNSSLQITKTLEY